MANDHRKNDRNHRRTECLLKQLRAAVKKDFGKDMENILGAPNMTKQDRATLMANNDGIIITIDELMKKLVANRHFKENVEIKVKQQAERKALDN